MFSELTDAHLYMMGSGGGYSGPTGGPTGGPSDGGPNHLDSKESEGKKFKTKFIKAWDKVRSIKDFNKSPLPQSVERAPIASSVASPEMAQAEWSGGNARQLTKSTLGSISENAAVGSSPSSALDVPSQVPISGTPSPQIPQ